MIVPMKKVSLVVMDKNREESLEKLRKIGVVHPEKKDISSDVLSKLLEQKTRVESALNILQPYGKNVKAPAENVGNPNPVKQILDYADEQKGLIEQLTQLLKERSRIEEWGNFNPHDISYLAEKANLNIFLYKIPRMDFDGLPEIRFIPLSADKENIRIIVFDQPLPEKEPFAIGQYSLKEIDSLLDDIRRKKAEVEGRLALLAHDKALVEKELKTILSEVEFEVTRAGMDVLDDVPSDSAVAWITGYVPTEDLETLKKEAAENEWALVADDPGPEDNVPTKLRNNRLVNLLNPLTGFLDVLPGYREVDISGWFLLFFTLFFGMIFSDAAYGALFIIIALICILRNLKKGVHPGFKLLLLLGCSNFIWGVLTCTWFGLSVEQIPLVLQQISLPQISNVTASESAYGEGIVRQNMMTFCFTLALLHLSMGHIIVITRTRNLQILAHLGAIAMLIGMYGVILSLIASNEFRQIPFHMRSVYILGGGFLLNFIFASYEGSIGKSIIASLKDIISVILGVANVFSDIMSYLRLWAVGLAGSAISSIVVTMAGPMLGHFIFFIFGVVLLVSGHGLNLVLNTLSVLVHGVRLNTLEFSGRVGLTWAGYAYKPFSTHEISR